MANPSIRKLSVVLALGAAGAILAGCPGTERTTAPSNQQIITDTISAALQQTGSVETGAEGSGQPAMANPSTDILVGDEDGNVNGTAVRGFIGFSLGSLPPGSQIQQATLTATQCAVNGFPFDNLGNVLIQHLVYAVPLDTTAFFAASTDSMFTLSQATTLGPRTVTVTSGVLADYMANRSSSQFRLSMSSTDLNADGVSDFVAFAADSAHTFDCKPQGGQQPKLVILYRPSPA